MNKIQDVQNSLRETILRALLVETTSGFEAQVSIKHKNGRKIKSNASAGCFQPEAGDSIEITFQRVLAPAHEAESVATPPLALQAPASVVPAPSTVFIRLAQALDHALTDLRHRFVSLKWFRDTELPQVGVSPDQARFELSLAIREGWVRIEKLANPNSSFPTSTLQLDRSHPTVRAALASSAPQSSPTAAPAAVDRRRAFQPVRLPPGVSASRMIIEDRR